MCRLIGEIALNTNRTNKQEFEKLCLLSKNGGPDSTDYWYDNISQYGFNRLSILDISKHGNQPLVSPSSRYVLMFNGEIYNYNELKKKYNINESRLRSSSDTEVIAQLLDLVSPIDIANELNGMFAISIYDRHDKSVYLIRDFAGIKPLFYGISTDGFVFASQFDQIFKHPFFKNALIPRNEIIKEYVQLGYMHQPNTVYKDIYQVKPGCIIKFNINKKSIEEIQYSSFFKNEGSFSDNEDANCDEFLDVFRNVIKDQLVSDVPIGTFLSGGVDSPLVTAVAKGFNDITALTVGVYDKKYNEANIAKKYAKQLDVKHDVEYFTTDQLLALNDLHFKSFPEPFGDYSSLPTYLITKKANKSFTVMLSGDGGDELFWGYPRFLNTVKHISWFKSPYYLRKGYAAFLRRIGERVSYGVSDYRSAGDWVLDQHSHNGMELSDKLLPGIDISDGLKETYFFKGSDKRELLNWLRRNEFYAHLQRVLIKVDRASMGNGLEVRVPFLDKRIIKYGEGLYSNLGINHFEPKILLKKSMAQFFSEKVINNKKMGFSIPIGVWLHHQLKEEVQDLILSRDAFGNDIFDRKELEKYLDSFYKHKNNNEWGIWILYALQKWYRIHLC